MLAFPIICGIILIIIAGIFMSKTKKEEVKPEVIVNKEDRPVLIEMFPKGTSNNPFKCKVNSEVALEVRGYSNVNIPDYMWNNINYRCWNIYE